ncbi:MAG TPA: YCF48-related protein [Ignavibacteriaceae bacterium]|nr:YCF48-related protein [Ignavibacteriaceae bacterium]
MNQSQFEDLYTVNSSSKEIKIKNSVNDMNEEWIELHPKVPRVNYWAVHFTNKDTGVAVGEQGAVIRTTDGGDKWLNVNTPFKKTFRGIGGNKDGRIIAAGDSGIIILSIDCGENWQLIQSGTSERLWNLQMINDELGWVVGEGAVALKTVDGGFTWISQVTPLAGYPFYDVSFLDSLFGYITAWGGQILRTTDGGVSWIVRQAGNPYTLSTIKAVTRQKAVALGFAGKHVYTSDGGESWQQLAGLGSTFRKIVFIDTLNGFAVGETGSFETIDGGETWDLRDDVKSARYVTFTNKDFGYVCGDGLILDKTTNAGQNWFRTIINDDFSDVFFTDYQNGWFIGYSWYQNNLCQTTDGGITLLHRTDFPGDRPSSVYFLDSLEGLVGVNNKIFKSYNGGLSWEEKVVNGIDSLLFGGEFDRLFFLNRNIGWALNNNYAINTQDGGETWQSKLNITGLTGIFFIDSLNGWVTPSGKPFKTTDGGETWLEQTSFPSNGANDVFFNDSLNGFISRSNALYRTTDGGINWTLVTDVTNFAYGRFSNIYKRNLFLAGGVRTYKTTNSGENWEEVTELRDRFIEYIRIWDINNGYAVGRTGLILKLIDSVVSVGDNNTIVPDKFYLYQNYPNPFNISTTIKFYLPKNSKVKITIYDSLGRQVKILVDKEYEAGFHPIKFNANELASGMYLYKIEGGDFNEAKKMILLK